MTTTSNRSKKSSPKRTSSRRRASQRRNNTLIWVFLAVLVALFGVLAYVSRSTGPTADITDATVSGDGLVPFGEGLDGALGRPAPELSGSDLDGEPMTIEPGDGTPKAIAFLAHWCPHCQREVPVVTQWVDEGNLPDGVDLVAVTTSIDRNRPNFPPQAWFERENWPVDTLVDGDESAARAYGLSGYPFWVLVDGDGNVVERWSGESTADQLTERIGKLAE